MTSLQPTITSGGGCPLQPAQQSGDDNGTVQLTAGVPHDDTLSGLSLAHAWQRVLWLVENAESSGFHTTPERPPRGAK